MELIRKLFTGVLFILLVTGVAIVSVTALFVAVAIIVGIMFMFGFDN